MWRLLGCTLALADVTLLQTALQLREEGVFVWQADGHVDPFYLTEWRQCAQSNLSLLEAHPYGTMGCDPPLALLESSFSSAAKQNGTSFVLYTGDFVRHGIRGMPDPEGNATAIVGLVSRRAKEIFETTPLLFGTLGNSDATQDYLEQLTENLTHNPWFWTLGMAMHGSGAMGWERLQTFAHGGFFEAREDNLTLLSLSTVMYSVYHLPIGPLEEDPYGQFQWLRERLGEAAALGQKVWIVGHIAPGIETYSYTELWSPQYVEKYLEIVQDETLGSVIAAQLFGHVHKDEVRVLPKPPEGAGPIFLRSSVSPVYFNHPSHKLVSYDRHTGRLLNLKTFVADSLLEAPGWRRGYDHRSAYGLESFEATEMLNLTQRLLEGGEAYERYAYWYASGYPNELQHFSKRADWNSTWKEQRRQEYVCAMTIRTALDFDACAGKTPRPWRLWGLDEHSRRLLHRLLSWASGSSTAEAKHVWAMALQGRFEELLRMYGAWVEWSQQQGTPLEVSVLTS